MTVQVSHVKIKQPLLKKRWVLWGLILLVTFIWGYAWVIMKAALKYIGPFTFSSLRFITGTITMLIIVVILRLGMPPRRYWKHLALIGFLQTAVMFLFVMFALRFVDAGKSSVLLYSMPIWSSLLAAKFLNEKLTGVKITGLLLGITGLLVIVGTDLIRLKTPGVILGETLIITAAIAWGISNVYYRKFVNELPRVQVSAFQMLFGTIVILLTALIMEWGKPVVWNAESIYYILFTGILASAFCFTLWFKVIGEIDMATATISSMLVPVFGLALSQFILGEKMTTSVLIGSALIIFGIVIAVMKTSPVQKKARIDREP